MALTTKKRTSRKRISRNTQVIPPSLLAMEDACFAEEVVEDVLPVLTRQVRKNIAEKFPPQRKLK